MKQKQKQKKETLGFNAQETYQQLNELITLKKKVIEELSVTPQFGSDEIFRKHTLLTQKLETINENIVQVREWYGLGISESLYQESKRLNTLTTVLIGLTAILGILTTIDILSRFL